MDYSPKQISKLFGIKLPLDEGELKKSYRRLAKNTHPDLAPTDLKDQWSKKFKIINSAYKRGLFLIKQPTEKIEKVPRMELTEVEWSHDFKYLYYKVTVHNLISFVNHTSGEYLTQIGLVQLKKMIRLRGEMKRNILKYNNYNIVLEGSYVNKSKIHKIKKTYSITKPKYIYFKIVKNKMIKLYETFLKIIRVRT